MALLVNSSLLSLLSCSGHWVNSEMPRTAREKEIRVRGGRRKKGIGSRAFLLLGELSGRGKRESSDRSEGSNDAGARAGGKEEKEEGSRGKREGICSEG